MSALSRKAGFAAQNRETLSSDLDKTAPDRDGLRNYHDARHEQLRDEIAKPEGRRVGQADDAHGQQAARPGQKNCKSDEEDERALLAHRYRRPEAYQAAAEVDAGQKAVNIVEPRSGLRLTQVHLQPAARECNGGEQEQADLDDALAC